MDAIQIQRSIDAGYAEILTQLKQLNAAIDARNQSRLPAEFVQRSNAVDVRQAAQAHNGTMSLKSFARRSVGLHPLNPGQRMDVQTRDIRTIVSRSMNLPVQSQPQSNPAATAQSFARKSAGVTPEPQRAIIQKSYSIREAARKSVGLPATPTRVTTRRPAANDGMDT